MSSDVTAIKLIPSFCHPVKETYKKQTKTKINKKQHKTSYLLPHAFMEDTVRHDIAQMTSTSKAYITYLLVIMVK